MAKANEPQDTKWSSFDVIKSMFACLEKEGKKEIPSSITILHNALYALYQKGKYKSFFKEYLFEYKTHYHYCDDFQTDLGNLQLAKMLSKTNPDFVRYEFREKLATTFDLNTSKKFTAEQLQIIESMANDFYAQVKIHEQKESQIIVS